MKLVLSDRHLDVRVEDAGGIRYIDLSAMKIANCMGCFGCWTKTPGKCVVRDDATKVYPCIAESDTVLYVSRIKYGCYDSVMKTMLERAIPVQQAFIRIHNGETHHVQRAVVPKNATVIAYGDGLTDEEKDIFVRLVGRNAHNMSFKDYRVVFTAEASVDDEVRKVLETWEK